MPDNEAGWARHGPLRVLRSRKRVPGLGRAGGGGGEERRAEAQVGVRSARWADGRACATCSSAFSRAGEPSRVRKRHTHRRHTRLPENNDGGGNGGARAVLRCARLRVGGECRDGRCAALMGGVGGQQQAGRRPKSQDTRTAPHLSARANAEPSVSVMGEIERCAARGCGGGSEGGGG